MHKKELKKSLEASSYCNRELRRRNYWLKSTLRWVHCQLDRSVYGIETIREEIELMLKES